MKKLKIKTQPLTDEELLIKKAIVLRYDQGYVLAEIKRFEPETNKTKARYVYSIGWLKETDLPNVQNFGEIGIEGDCRFTFIDNFCPLYFGEYPAVIVNRFDINQALGIDINRADFSMEVKGE